MSGFLLNPYSYSSIVAGDPYWANVRNLIGFENGVVDEKTGVNWQVQGTLPPSASAAKFGNYGLPATTSETNYWRYDAGTSLSIPTTQECLIEAWINPVSFAPYGTIFSIYEGTNPKIYIIYDSPDTKRLIVYAGTSGDYVGAATVGNDLYDGNYKYLALYRAANETTWKLYFQGSLVLNSSVVTGNLTYRFITLGVQRGGISPANTKIDEFRITVGGSRGAPTSIPTTAFPRS